MIISVLKSFAGCLVLVAVLVMTGGSAQAAGVPAWTPSAISVAAWYDAADAGTVLTSGSAVTNWLDKSGNNLHLIQVTPANQPATGSSINSLNALDFTSNVMATASNPFAPIVSNAFVIAVHKVDSIGAGTLFSLTGSGTAANRWHAHAPYNDGTLYFDCGGSSGTNRVSVSYGVSTGNVVLVSFYCSTAANVQQVYKNGSLLIGDTSGNAINTGGNIQVGALGAEYQDTTLGEIIIINGTVSATTRQKLEGYLAHKWGLVANLPTTHPFKIGPPSSGGGVVTYTDSNGLNPRSTLPYDGGYVVHTFYGSDTFSNATATSVDVLVVGGGGGGGGVGTTDWGAGGGAGGLVYSNAFPVAPSTTYTVTVGAGGTAGGAQGGSGSSSVFGPLTALG